jgi:methionyl-tRNA formyltransferase
MPLDIVFIGSTGFSVRLLEGLRESTHPVVKVITLADRPAGRGLKKRRTPVKEAAASLAGCELAEWDSLDVTKTIDESVLKETGLGVVAAFGKIMPPAFIQRFPAGIINVHPSLLPQLRGAAPVQRAIMQGHRLTGVSLAFLDEGIDTGGVIDQAELEISENDDLGSLEDQLASLAIRLLLKNLDLLERNGSLPASPQDDALATYAHPIQREDCIVDWSLPDFKIFNQIRALSPRPGAYTHFRGKRVKIMRARLTGQPSEGSCGAIEKIGKHDMLVHTATCSLLVTDLQPEGGRVLSAGEFLRGYRIGEMEAFSRE